MKISTNCNETCETCYGMRFSASCVTAGDCVIGETCVCEEGYKMEDSKCIPKEECGCYDSDGKKYNEEEVYPSPTGNTCEEWYFKFLKSFLCHMILIT